MADIRRMTSVGARGTNPVLPAGVYGWERDTGVVKLGDGVTQWNNLGLAGIAMAVLRENHALGQHDHEGVAHGEVPQW